MDDQFNRPLAGKQEKVETLISSLNHHLSHFILSSRLGEVYDDIPQLEKAKGVLDTLIKASKEEPKASVLQEIKKVTDNIDINSAVDQDLLDNLNALLAKLGS